MDTRTKILEASPTLELPEATLVAGYFDPLQAAQARLLAQLPRPVIVLLADPPDPLLDSRSRAELVAGLAAVSQVVLPLPGGEPYLPAGRDVTLAQDADLDRRRALIEHVHRRHR